MSEPLSVKRSYYNCYYFRIGDAPSINEYLLLLSEGEVFGYMRYFDGSCIFASNKDVSSLLSFVEKSEFSPASIIGDHATDLADKLIKIFPRNTPLPASSIALSPLFEEFRNLLPKKFIEPCESLFLDRID